MKSLNTIRQLDGWLLLQENTNSFIVKTPSKEHVPFSNLKSAKSFMLMEFYKSIDRQNSLKIKRTMKMPLSMNSENQDKKLKNRILDLKKLQKKDKEQER